MSSQDKIRIGISGGDWVEREMLGDLVSGVLHDRGFNGVVANNAVGDQLPADKIGYHSPRTILDTIDRMRPDLRNKTISVEPDPMELISMASPQISNGDRFSKWGEPKQIPGTFTLVRDNKDTNNSVIDTRYYDVPGKMVETAATIGYEAKHIGIRAETIENAVEAVHEALRAAPGAYVTVSLREYTSVHEDIDTPASVFFNDAPEKDIIPLPPPLNQLAIARGQQPYFTNGEAAQLRKEIAEDLVTSEGFQELVEDIAHDMLEERVRDIVEDRMRGINRGLESYKADLEHHVREQMTVDPAAMRQLENTIADLRELNSRPPLSDLSVKSTSDYVPPKEDEPTPADKIIQAAGKALEEPGAAEKLGIRIGRSKKK